MDPFSKMYAGKPAHHRQTVQGSDIVAASLIIAAGIRGDTEKEIIEKTPLQVSEVMSRIEQIKSKNEE